MNEFDYIKSISNILDVPFIEILQYIHNNYYINEKIHIVHDFIDMINSTDNEFIFHNIKLYEYDLIPNEYDTIQPYLTHLNMVLNIDYSIVCDSYLLTKHAFKKCALIRNNNKTKYYFKLESIYIMYLTYINSYKDELLKSISNDNKLLQIQLDNSKKLLEASPNIKINNLLCNYYGNYNSYTDENMLNSKCIKMFEIIYPNEILHKYYTFMYCSINNIYKSINDKLINHKLDFHNLKLIKVFRPANDSVFGMQNLMHMLKKYCRLNGGNYNARNCKIRVDIEKHGEMIKTIIDYMDNNFNNSIKNFNMNERTILNIFFQTKYIKEIKEIIEHILNSKIIKKDDNLLELIKFKLLHAINS